MNRVGIQSRLSSPIVRRVSAGVALATCIVVLVVALMRKPAYAAGHSPEAIALKQKRAASLEYPEPGPLPPSLALSYDEAKNRSKLVLTLGSVSAASNGARLSSVTLTITSRFDGLERTSGELSVQCELSLISSEPGVLAPSSPPGVLVVDGKELNARRADSGHAGYSSKPKGDGSHESLEFNLATRDLLKIAAARSLTATFGTTRVTFTAAQIHDIRELAARLKPTTQAK